MKLKKHRIFEKMQNGYVLCKLKSNAFPNFYYLYDAIKGHCIDDIDMRSVHSILKMCKVNSKGDYELNQIFK